MRFCLVNIDGFHDASMHKVSLIKQNSLVHRECRGIARHRHAGKYRHRQSGRGSDGAGALRGRPVPPVAG